MARLMIPSEFFPEFFLVFRYEVKKIMMNRKPARVLPVWLRTFSSNRFRGGNVCHFSIFAPYCAAVCCCGTNGDVGTGKHGKVTESKLYRTIHSFTPRALAPPSVIIFEMIFSTHTYPTRLGPDRRGVNVTSVGSVRIGGCVGRSILPPVDVQSMFRSLVGRSVSDFTSLPILLSLRRARRCRRTSEMTDGRTDGRRQQRGGRGAPLNRTGCERNQKEFDKLLPSTGAAATGASHTTRNVTCARTEKSSTPVVCRKWSSFPDLQSTN